MDYIVRVRPCPFVVKKKAFYISHRYTQIHTDMLSDDVSESIVSSLPR